jgi:rubrerythrin
MRIKPALEIKGENETQRMYRREAKRFKRKGDHKSAELLKEMAKDEGKHQEILKRVYHI